MTGKKHFYSSRKNDAASLNRTAPIINDSKYIGTQCNDPIIKTLRITVLPIMTLITMTLSVMTLRIMTLSTMTLSMTALRMTLTIMTFSTMTLSMMTLRLVTLSVTELRMTPSITINNASPSALLSKTTIDAERN
jgi:hypothetical protein